MGIQDSPADQQLVAWLFHAQHCVSEPLFTCMMRRVIVHILYCRVHGCTQGCRSIFQLLMYAVVLTCYVCEWYRDDQKLPTVHTNEKASSKMCICLIRPVNIRFSISAHIYQNRPMSPFIQPVCRGFYNDLSQHSMSYTSSTYNAGRRFLNCNLFVRTVFKSSLQLIMKKCKHSTDRFNGKLRYTP